MSGLVMPGGSSPSKPQGGGEVPAGLQISIDPKGYMSTFCPYQSGIYGGAATVTQMGQLANQIQQGAMLLNQHAHVRCHSACVHFDGDLLKAGERSGCRVDHALTAQIKVASLLEAQVEEQRELLREDMNNLASAAEGAEGDSA